MKPDPFFFSNNGPNAGQKCDLKGPHCVMGRNPDCEIVVDVDAVSRQHAKVILESPNYFVQDLNSRNHTFLSPYSGDHLRSRVSRREKISKSFGVFAA